MEQWFHDLRFGLRALARRPLFTVAAVLALGLGIGANGAIYSVFDAVLLSPLDYPEPDRLVRLWARHDGKGLEKSRLSPVVFHDLGEQATSFEELAAWWRPDLNLTSGEGDPERVRAIFTTDGFFDVLGVEPMLGRGFTDGEDRPGGPAIAVLGHGLWSRRFGGEDVLGESVELDGRPFEIVGVMPPGFDFPEATELWLPLGWEPANHSRHARFFGVVGRLSDGIGAEAARAELDRLADTWATDFPASDTGWVYDAPSLRDDLVGELRPAFRLLLGAVGCVLLIACANVAHLLLAMGAGRRREMAVRGALGAGRGRLAAQCLAESLLLGGLGGLLGIVLAIVGVRALVAVAPPDLPRLDEVAVDGSFLLGAFGVALLSSLVFGLAPVLQATRTDLRSALGEGGRSAGPLSNRLRGGLVVAEVALAMALLVGAGLLVRSLDRLLDHDPGFRTEGVLTFNLQLPQRSYEDWAAVNGFYDRLLDELAETPGIESAALAGFLPLEPGWRVEFEPEGRATEGDEPEAQYRPVSPEWFETMGVRVEVGRGFDDRDREDRPGVVVINRSAAERYWPDEDPVGRRITGRARGFGPLGRVLTETLEAEVVGVVNDVANVSLGGPVEPAIYFPHRQLAYRSMHVVTVGDADPRAAMAAAKDAVWRLDPRLPLDRLRPLDADLAASVADRRFVLRLVAGFAILALVLVAIGIYGVVSYLAGQRRREMGIRLALGAGRGSVVRLVVGQGLALVGLGVAVGCLAAWALRQTLASLVYGIGTADPVALGGAAAVALGAGLLASWIPAMRAGRVDPVEVLQSE